MADPVAEPKKLSPEVNVLITDKSEVCRENCNKLNLKLQKTMTGLSSALAIIKLLYEDGKEHNLLKRSETPIRLEEKWIVVKSCKQERFKKSYVSNCPAIPCNVNRFKVLSEPVKACGQDMSQKNREVMQNKDYKREGSKHKILIIGDSHARGCATEMKAILNKDFEVQGFVYPGAGLKTITSTAKNDISKLSKKDVVIVWGGSKDVGRNEVQQGIPRLQNFVESFQHTNVILMEAPHRHDLTQDSCVNKEVRRFNSKLRKCMKIYGNAEVIKVNLERRYYTRHGLHMNVTGKELMAKNIIETIQYILKPSKRTPLAMKWKNEENVQNQDPKDDKKTAREKSKYTENRIGGLQVEGKIDRQEEEETEVKTSRRSRKIPVTRSSDFLWPNIRNKEKLLETGSEEFLG